VNNVNKQSAISRQPSALMGGAGGWVMVNRRYVICCWDCIAMEQS
jgi:hypothetical protein